MTTTDNHKGPFYVIDPAHSTPGRYETLAEAEAAAEKWHGEIVPAEQIAPEFR